MRNGLALEEGIGDIRSEYHAGWTIDDSKGVRGFGAGAAV